MNHKYVPVLVQASLRANPPPRKSRTPHGIFFSTIFHVTNDGDRFGMALIDWNGLGVDFINQFRP
jgi:hypothetical protein